MIWLASALMFILISSMAAMCIDVWEHSREVELDELWDDDLSDSA